MSDSLIEKIVSGVLRGLTGLIVTGGGYQLFDGHWYGQTIFQSYLSRLGLQPITSPPSTEFYSAFASDSIPTGLRESSTWLVIASLFIGLAALAHIVGKPTASQLSKTATRPEPLRLRARKDLKHLLKWSRFFYVAYQPLITIALFLVLTGFFFGWPFERGLALAFLITAIPAALYLLLYPTDLSGGAFLERFAYITVLALLVVVLVGWPQRYGRTLFDPDLPSVFDVDNSPGHCDQEQLLKGPAFVLFEKGQEQVILRVCFDRQGNKQYVDYFVISNRQLERVGTATLSQAVESFVRPTIGLQ